MQILLNKDINRTQWAEFVLSHPKGNVFQTPEMYDVYMQTPGHEPHVIALEHDKQLVGVLLWVVMREKGIKARFSARSIIQGAPLAKDDKPEYIVALLEAYENNTPVKLRMKGSGGHYDFDITNNIYYIAEFWADYKRAYMNEGL